MSATTLLPAPARAAIQRAARSPLAVWIAFVLVHLWLGYLNLFGPGYPLGDVTSVYRFWTDHGFLAGNWVGIDAPWVYPILAIVPMIAAAAFGPEQHASTWLSLVLLLDIVAFGVLTGWGRSRARLGVAWWWIAFLLLLGPIAMGRIDSVTVPLAIVGVLYISTRPRLATALLAAATWMKVWPAALIAAALIALKARWIILSTAVLFSVGVVAGALALGSGSNVFSFITEQTGRGLQVESPVATIWLWRALAGAPGTGVHYNREIITYQVDGPGTAVASSLMTPLLAIAVLGIVVLGVRATRAGASATDLLAPLSLALVTAFIALNKVGSPQYITWLAVPIILGIVTNGAGHGQLFRFPAIVTLVIAGLTQVIYPVWYRSLLDLNPLLLGAITVRNILEFVLVGWAVLAVMRAPHPAQPGDSDHSLLSRWPLRGAPDSSPVSSVRE